MGALSTVKIAVKLYILCANTFLIAIVKIQSFMNFFLCCCRLAII